MLLFKMSSRKQRYTLVFAMFTINFLQAGMVKSLGVFLEVIQYDLSTSTAAIGFVFGIPSAVAYISAPVSVHLCTRFGFRRCMMIGGILMTSGWCITALFATSIMHVGFSLVLAGIGAGLLIVPSNVKIIPYFDKNLAMANAVGQSGVLFGFMVMPQLSKTLTDVYSWRGSLLILAAFVFHNCAMAALVGPHSPSPTNDELDKSISDDQDSNQEYRNRSDSSNYKLCFETIKLSVHGSLQIFIDKPIFLIQTCVFSLLAVSMLAWSIFLVPHAVSSNIPLNKAVFLSTIGSLGGIIGSLHAGQIIDRHWLTSTQAYFYFTFANILAVTIDFFVPSLLLKIVSAFVGGFSLFGRGTLRLPMTNELFDDSSCSAGLGVSYFFYGIACILGTTLPGWINDLTGSFRHSFLVIAAVETVSVLVLALSYSQSILDSMCHK